MWKKILSISLVLLVALSLAACGEKAGEDGELPSAQEVVDGVVQSLDDIRTYQFEMNMSMDASGEVEGEAVEATIVMDSSGALDLENRQVRMDMTMNVAVPGEDEMEMGVEMYLIGDMVYMLAEAPGTPPTWMKSEMPEGYWEQQNQVEPQIELLEAAEVEVLGSEKVGGIDCWVLQVTPDTEQLWQMVMQQTVVTGGEMLPPVAEEFLKEMFRNYSVKQWIAKDTYFLTKVEIDMAVEFTPEAMEAMGEEGEMTMDITTSLLAYDYNQPVSIVLPPEAEEAIEVPMWY